MVLGVICLARGHEVFIGELERGVHFTVLLSVHAKLGALVQAFPGGKDHVLVRNVHHAHEDIEPPRQNTRLEQPDAEVRGGYQGYTRDYHREGFEWKSLAVRLLVVSWVFDHGWDFQILISTGHTEEQPEDIASERAVGVGLLQVKNGGQLREEDHVDQVSAQVPQHVDGLNGQCHGKG